MDRYQRSEHLGNRIQNLRRQDGSSIWSGRREDKRPRPRTGGLFGQLSRPSRPSSRPRPLKADPPQRTSSSCTRRPFWHVGHERRL